MMEEAKQNREKIDLSMQMNGFSRNVLHKFMNGKRFTNEEEEEGENEEIELSLGLSMNGRFGVDPKREAKKLKRSSSISNLVFTVGAGSNGCGRQAVGLAVDLYAPLTRTCSLPNEAEEELRRRKELQTMRRMEAKRKRMEKLKNGRLVKDRVDLEENSCEDNNNTHKTHEFNGTVDGSNTNVKGKINGNGNEMPSSQGSIGSQGSGSSGISDLQSQRSEGLKQGPEGRSPSSIQSLPTEHKTVRAAEKEAQDILKNIMLDMPCVSTKGDGPDGNRIEGFLYRYKKGEEVKIVCVCHGTFLSPAEFVKHAGGGDVAHPLKHIVVNHSPLL